MNGVAENKNALEISSTHWSKMKETIFSSWDYQRISLSDELEFRFVPMPEQSFSALLSYRGKDVFHFMWTEVEGMINITHRIVHPDFRGQGIATTMMQAIEDRAQQLANAQQVPYFLLLETSQLSVVRLGEKCGMSMTQGKEAWNDLQNYHIDQETHVTNDNQYRIQFRLSKKVVPEYRSLLEHAQLSTRMNILRTLAPTG